MGFLYPFRFLHQPCRPILTPKYLTNRKFLVPQVFEYAHVSSQMPEYLPSPPITVTTVRMPTVSRRPPVHGPLWYPNVEMQCPPNVLRLHQSYAQSRRERRPIKIEKPPDLQEFTSFTSQNHFQQPNEVTEPFTNENILHEYKVETKRTQVKSSPQHLDKMEKVQNYEREQNKRELFKPSNLKPQPNTQQKNIKDHWPNNHTNSTAATNRLRNTKACEADKSKYSNKHGERTQEKKTETIKSVTESKDSYERKTVRKEKTKTYKKQHIQVSGDEFAKRTSVKTYIKNDSKDYYKTTTKESTSYSRKHSCTSTIKTKVSHIKEVLKDNELNHKERDNVESVSLTIEHYPSNNRKQPDIKRHRKERSKRHTTGQSKNLQEVSKGAQIFSKVNV